MYESVLTCPVLSDSLFVTLTFSKVITWKNIKSYQNIRRFQRRSCDKVSFIRTFNFRWKILADDDIVKYFQLCKTLQMLGWTTIAKEGPKNVYHCVGKKFSKKKVTRTSLLLNKTFTEFAFTFYWIMSLNFVLDIVHKQWQNEIPAFSIALLRKEHQGDSRACEEVQGRPCLLPTRPTGGTRTGTSCCRTALCPAAPGTSSRARGRRSRKRREPWGTSSCPSSWWSSRCQTHKTCPTTLCCPECTSLNPTHCSCSSPLVCSYAPFSPL